MKNYQLEEYQEYEETHLVRTWYYDVDSLKCRIKEVCFSKNARTQKYTLKNKDSERGVS